MLANKLEGGGGFNRKSQKEVVPGRRRERSCRTYPGGGWVLVHMREHKCERTFSH